MLKLLAKVGLNGFFFCLIGVIFLAYYFPTIGLHQSPWHLPQIAEYGVSVIFFFYGLKLSPQKLKSGLTNWKLHILIQTATFGVFPLLILCLQYFLDVDKTSLFWIGIFYLAALPSTVSSSVVMVAIAKGNLPAAIFNASISSIIGIFITPLWMSGLLEQQDANFDLLPVILRLCFEVLLPVIVGYVLHSQLSKWAERYNHLLRLFDQTIILLIVYTSFCESFAGGMFEGQSIRDLSILGGEMLSFFFLIFGLLYALSSWLGFSYEDRVTVIFCGSKKSLVQGAVMGKVLFPNPVSLGVVLLPLMMYHALQLLAGSIIAQQWGSKH
ncbi:bile acid:sodium symporter [Runella sp. MFBS21]|uniref:bile acid:sodium symporter family protein n=1 Tax=Runella sp. MFBS21 TaxID=3034018 RepID=UPI0023F934C9|nr:bile acid:sodium symporter family protein [Runella sp. MFBS21]MDF7816110.1 bile acid:sodium symporter [Runella sp. MFBS21]